MASSGGSSNIQISEARPVSETASSCCRGSRGFLDLLTADLTSALKFPRWRWRLTGIRDPHVDRLTPAGWVSDMMDAPCCCAAVLVTRVSAWTWPRMSASLNEMIFTVHFDLGMLHAVVQDIEG